MEIEDIIRAAIADGSLSIDLVVQAVPGPYDSGDGVKAIAAITFKGTRITESETDDYMSVEQL